MFVISVPWTWYELLKVCFSRPVWVVKCISDVKKSPYLKGGNLAEKNCSLQVETFSHEATMKENKYLSWV